MYITTIRNIRKYQVMDCLFMGLQYEQVGDDVGVWYDDEETALEDIEQFKGEWDYEIWEYAKGTTSKNASPFVTIDRKRQIK